MKESGVKFEVFSKNLVVADFNCLLYFANKSPTNRKILKREQNLITIFDCTKVSVNLRKMKLFKSFTSLSIAALTLFPAVTEVKSEDYEKGFYASIGFGLGTYSDPLINGTPFSLYFDRGFSYEGSLGYDFGKYFRVDASYTNTTSNVHGAEEAVFGAYIFNGYLDVPLGDTKWTPFIGIGYGATNVDVSKLCTSGGDDDCKDDVATFSLSGGLSYAISSDIEITGKYTYLGFDTINVWDDATHTVVADSETHTVHVGLRFKF